MLSVVAAVQQNLSRLWKHLPLYLDGAAAARVPTQEQYFRLHVSLRVEMLLQDCAKRCTLDDGFCVLPRALSLWVDENG